MRRKLTDLAVSRIKEPGIVWDVLLPGFGIRVSSRSKVWIIATRRPGSRHPVRLRLGAYPSMGLLEARDRAREIMAGGARPATTFAKLAADFLAHGKTRSGRPLRQNTIDQYRRLLRRHGAALEGRMVADLKRSDIAPVVGAVARRSGTTTAALVRAVLARLFAYGIEVGAVESNPATGTPSYAVTPRSRVLSDAEIAGLWAATQVGFSDPGGDYNLILRMCLWCGVRRGEAGGIRWSELPATVAGSLWTIPGTRTKNHRGLALPIPRQMVAALEAWPQIVGRDHLFGRASLRGFSRWSEGKARLDRALHFNQGFDLHDLRRTTETRLARLGVVKEVRSRILNHDIGDIDEAYQHHDFLEEKRAALQSWADEIDRLAA